MEFSAFGRRFCGDTGVRQLMLDLGEAASSTEKIFMLGGGNPGDIPQVNERLRDCLQSLATNDNLRNSIGSYGSPQGDHRFIASLATLLKEKLSWPISSANIALTNGSQSAFFALFNLLAGEPEINASSALGAAPIRQVLLPMAPEYIGYGDTGLVDDLFRANRPIIEFVGEQQFKYRVNFSTLQIDETVGAMCVSRPSNPTGNVLTDSEIEQLASLSATHDVPLIIDSAYGLPFPNIVFADINPFWNDNIILCLSLSKLGMPGARTGIVIASAEIISALTAINAILSLAVGRLGPAIAQPLLESGEILTMSDETIRPFYLAKMQRASQWLESSLAGTPWRMHVPEGAFFLWLWFEDLPISSQQLYERLKERRVFVIAGHHFFPGLEEDHWRHKQECIRITYAADDADVCRGIEIIGEVVREAYAGG